MAADVREVAGVRRYVRGLLGEGHPAVDDVELCAGEVVANSVIHTGSDKVSAAFFGARRLVRVEVTDAGAAGTAPHLCREPSGEHGRGLLLVDAMTGGRWGTRHGHDGQTLWFEISF